MASENWRLFPVSAILMSEKSTTANICELKIWYLLHFTVMQIGRMHTGQAILPVGQASKDM